MNIYNNNNYVLLYLINIIITFIMTVNIHIIIYEN